MAVVLPDSIWLFEFKVVELLPDGLALQQLQDKKDADKYRARGLQIHLIRVGFKTALLAANSNQARTD
jgi:hypothetical protein